MIYLDNAATTLRKPPCVIGRSCEAMQTLGNSGRSAHAENLTASRTILTTRSAGCTLRLRTRPIMCASQPIRPKR